MAKRMTDDEVQNYVYSKMFGDMDGIEAHSMFDESPDEHVVEGTVENAEPASKESGGMKITIEPLMAAAQEGGKPSDTSIVGEEHDEDDEDHEDKLKGIGKMSPMMSRLHGDR